LALLIPSPHTLKTTACTLMLAVSLAGCVSRQVAPRQPVAGRIVAVGDLHGDLAATRSALRLAGAIDESDRWIGGDMTVVQVGDVLDRGDQERAILEMFVDLARQAAAQGGAFHALNGNHELMNVLLDMRYVTEGGYRDFRGAAGALHSSDPLLLSHPVHQRDRVHAFRPGGEYARVLAASSTILIIGDNVFVHGGVLPEHARYGIDRINLEVRDWLLGRSPAPRWATSPSSPVWTRRYSTNVDGRACAAAGETLKMLGASRMIIGHTPHRTGITSYCDERVWVVDVGLAAYYGGPVEVLEIAGDGLRVIRGDRR
jgi:hypothetical protein